MSDLVPATQSQQGSILTPLTDPAGGNAMSRLRTFAGQGAVRRMLPWFLGVSALGAVALTYQTLAPAPQRTLYAELNDSERAGVVDALEKASIAYKINNETGSLTVNEDDLYKARMLVAQNGSVAAPQSGDDLLDKLPMGASRELEGQRLRSARERTPMFCWRRPRQLSSAGKKVFSLKVSLSSCQSRECTSRRRSCTTDGSKRSSTVCAAAGQRPPRTTSARTTAMRRVARMGEGS